MCGACGAICGEPDWIDRVGNPAGVSHRPDLTRTAERQRQIAIVNLVLAPRRLSLFDSAAGLVLRSPTGSTEMVRTLSHVWAAADRMSTSAIDPLDEEVLSAIERKAT